MVFFWVVFLINNNEMVILIRIIKLLWIKLKYPKK